MTSVHILMNEKIFPNSKSFIPERWINRPDLDRYFVPFGKGSRACLGIKYFSPPFSAGYMDESSLLNNYHSLAQAELYIALATIFSRFNFEFYETDISDVEMAHGYLVPYPKWESKGVRVRVKTTTS
jgi:hypothetical protein